MFWIPVEGAGIDRSGLAITTVLAAQFMMYDAKVTKETTWLDYYFSMMLIFQFFAFVLMVHSSRVSRLGAGDDDDDASSARAAAHGRKERAARDRSAAHGAAFWANLVLGGDDVVWVDRWARRGLMPLFYASQVLICFYPWSGDGEVYPQSPHSGLNAPLFRINAFCLGAFFLVVVLALVFRIDLDGPAHDDDDATVETVEAEAREPDVGLVAAPLSLEAEKKTKRRKRSPRRKSRPAVPAPSPRGYACCGPTDALCNAETPDDASDVATGY